MHFTEEQRRNAIDLMETSATEAGFDLYKGAQWIVGYMDRKRPYLEAAHSRASLDAYLANASAKDEEEILKMLALLRAFPKIANEFISELLVNTAASIPTPVGPPRKLTPEIEREIVAKIGKLHTNGVPLGIAQTRVAKQLGLGKRTVQGVWGKRQSLAAQPFQSVKDVWEFFKVNTSRTRET